MQSCSNYKQPCILEVAIISAQGLKKPSGLFSGRLKPFIIITNGDFNHDGKVYVTRVDDKGGVNPAWGEKFELPLDAAFFHHSQSCIYLQLCSKHLIWGRTRLGWCRIPAADILPSLFPAGSVGHLSYRLWGGDGARGHGVLNVGVRLLEGSLPNVNNPQRPSLTNNNVPYLPGMKPSQTVIGIPMTMHLGQQLTRVD